MGLDVWCTANRIENRGTHDVYIAVCHGVKGLPDAITTVWDRAIVLTCLIQLLRNMFSLSITDARSC